MSDDKYIATLFFSLGDNFLDKENLLRTHQLVNNLQALETCLGAFNVGNEDNIKYDIKFWDVNNSPGYMLNIQTNNDKTLDFAIQKSLLLLGEPNQAFGNIAQTKEILIKYLKSTTK